jgi:ribosomal protein L40E
MPEILHCDRCGGDNPNDARFCIDCGAPIGAATTGPTTRLTGIICRSCNTNNPEHARFCVVCGRAFGAAAPPQPRSAAPPAATPAPTRPAARPSYPRMATPPTLTPWRQWSPARPPMPTHRRQGLGNDPGGVVFLIGLVALLASHTIWPGILLLLGLTNLVHQAARGRPDHGVRGLIWLGGLTLLFATGTFWPGILILFFISMAMGGGARHWYW